MYVLKKKKNGICPHLTLKFIVMKATSLKLSENQRNSKHSTSSQD